MKNEWMPAFGKMVYGIYVLTTAHEGMINGMIASWVVQVSYDPPLIMAAVHPNRYTHQLIEKSGRFVLHLISKDRKDFLKRFKGPHPPAKFSSVEWKKGLGGCPVLKDCAAWFECEVETAYTPGNHTLFIGKVLKAGVHSATRVLNTTDYNGVYLGKD